MCGVICTSLVMVTGQQSEPNFVLCTQHVVAAAAAAAASSGGSCYEVKLADFGLSRRVEVKQQALAVRRATSANARLTQPWWVQDSMSESRLFSVKVSHCTRPGMDAGLLQRKMTPLGLAATCRRFAMCADCIIDLAPSQPCVHTGSVYYKTT
jgi:hypothetical protein